MIVIQFKRDAKSDAAKDKRYMNSLEQKYQNLKMLLASYDALAVAYSGGVDSSLLVYVAHEVLGAKALALTAIAPLVSRQELVDAQRFCERYGIAQKCCQPDVMQIEGVRFNAPERCYVCKKAIFSELFKLAHGAGIEILADGSNVDDLDEYRPGKKALEELGVKSPLIEAGFTKHDIRALSQRLQLPTWNKQSNACLATRFPYGTELTSEKLTMVEKAEHILAELGFSQVRVRVHGTLARIEVLPCQFDKAITNPIRESIVSSLTRLGFTYVTLDLVGYSSGSMNATINTAQLPMAQPKPSNNQ